MKSEVAGEHAGSPINYPRTEHKPDTNRAQTRYNRAQIQYKQSTNPNRLQIRYKESTNPAQIEIKGRAIVVFLKKKQQAAKFEFGQNNTKEY